MSNLVTRNFLSHKASKKKELTKHWVAAFRARLNNKNYIDSFQEMGELCGKLAIDVGNSVKEVLDHQKELLCKENMDSINTFENMESTDKIETKTFFHKAFVDSILPQGLLRDPT